LKEITQVSKIRDEKDPEKPAIDAMIASYFKNLNLIISGQIVKSTD
jgi:tetratricopeptide (TPR) repeat protein